MAHFLETFLIALDKKHKGLSDLCQEYIKLYPDTYCIIQSELTHQYTYQLMQKERFIHNAKPYYAQLSLKLCALSNWRYTKSIYRFDETLLQELVMQPLDEIPIQLLYKLRESAFFIEIEPTSDSIQRYLLRGFFIHYEYRDKNYFLRLTFLDYDDRMSFLEIPIDYNQTVRQVIAQTLQKVPIIVDISERQLLEKRLRMTLNLVLYLCADNTDFSGRKEPIRPSLYKEPKSLHFYTIGTQAGQLLKDYHANMKQSQSRSKMRPHMRSAHWHTYWTGKDRQIPKLNWIDPIFIHQDEES